MRISEGQIIWAILYLLCVGKGEVADVVDLILHSVLNTLHAQHHVGKRLKQNASLGYVMHNTTSPLLA